MNEKNMAASDVSSEKKLIRIAAIVEYNGASFHGWQRQKHHDNPTIQAALERAISKVANHPIDIVCAGRTDAGVHASTQVIHFDTHAARKDYGWMLGINSNLPEGIAVRNVQFISSDFHARFTATARRYRYLIYNKKIRQALFANQLTWHKHQLDEQKMHEAVQHLIGEHDFSSFRARDCQSNTPNRNIHSASVKRYGDIVMLEVQANAFLYHMIRNIVGVLLPIGEGKQSPGWAKWVLEQADRTKAGITAPSEGLYFVGVEYPDEFNIPSKPWGPVFVEPWLV